MDSRDYWNAYVDRCGGLRATAEKLGTPYSTVAGISNGSRGIGPDLVTRFVARDSSLDPNMLIWVRPTRSAA